MQKPVENKLTEAFKDKVLDRSVNGIYVYDLVKGTNIYINKQYTNLTGYTLEAINSMTSEEFFALFHPADQAAISQHMNLVVSSEIEEIREIEYRFKKADGQWIWCFSRDSVFTINREGAPTEFMGTFIDITKRKEAEIAQKQTESKLISTNQELEQLVYSVSHDLRAPVRHIESYADRMKEEEESNLTEDGKTHLERIIQVAKRLGSMIDELLAYSSTRNAKPSKSWIDVQKLVSDILEEFKQSHTEQVISWELLDLPPCYADPEMMRQIWENLISNAVKYSSKEKKTDIKIRAEKKEEDIIFSIHDNGVGFNKAFKNKLFAVFQRLHTKREFPGHGIGLANVARMLQLHDGKIWGESVLGEGASFYFTIPIPQST